MAIIITIKSEREVEEWIAEARKILRLLNLPVAGQPHEEIIKTLMLIGLGHLRALKTSRDTMAAARQMDATIKNPATLRPSREEAGLN
jgi:hypothetical protein